MGHRDVPVARPMRQRILEDRAGWYQRRRYSALGYTSSAALEQRRHPPSPFLVLALLRGLTLSHCGPLGQPGRSRC